MFSKNKKILFDLNIQNFQEINLFDPKRRLVRFGALREPMGYVKKKKIGGGLILAYYTILGPFVMIFRKIHIFMLFT